MRVARALASIVIGVLSALPPAFADVSAGDIQIMARALSFMEKPFTGEVSVGIVYSPGNTQSVRDAGSVQRLLEGGLKVGSLTLKPVAVPIAEVGRANVSLLLLTAGLNEEATSIGAASRARRIPCVTTDLSQVKNGTCALGIRSQPKIEILVNRAAAVASGTSFSTVFRMMITEL